MGNLNLTWIFLVKTKNFEQIPTYKGFESKERGGLLPKERKCLLIPTNMQRKPKNPIIEVLKF